MVDLDVCIDLDSSPDLDAYLALNVSLDLYASPDLNASPFLACIEDGYPANFCLSLAISDGSPSRSTGNVSKSYGRACRVDPFSIIFHTPWIQSQTTQNVMFFY